MSEIVKFTLEKYGVKARWRIIPLNKEKWVRYSADRNRREILSWLLKKEIKNLMEKNKAYLEENTDFKNEISEMFKMKKEENEKEYGKATPLMPILFTLAAVMVEVKPLKVIFRNKEMSKMLPFYYKLFKKNKGRDFLILLNAPLTSKYSKKGKLKILVHETIHYIQDVNEMVTNFESIQKEADIIVDEFQISREKKND